MSNFIKKYHSLSNPVKVSLWFSIASFLQMGINFLTAPIFARLLSSEEFGIVNVYNSWSILLLIILSFSLYKSLMNLYVKYDNKEKTLSIVISLSLLITILWLVIFLIFYKEISALLGLSEILSLSIFINVVFTGAINCWTIFKKYTYDYKSIILYTLLTTIISALVSIIVVVFFYQSAEGRILPRVLITAFVSIPILIAVFKKGKKIYDKEIWKFSIIFSGSLIPHYLSEFILSSSDKLMINYILDSTAVAIYSIAYTIGSIITVLTIAINASFAPYQYQMIKKQEYKKLSKSADTVFILVAFFVIIIMFFSYEIVWLYGGQKYLQSASLIIPIGLGVFFNYMFQLFARVQEYFERKKMVVIPSVLAATLNIVLNLIFIPKYGFQAAAYTTFLSYALFCFIHYLFYRSTIKKYLNNQAIYNGKNLLVISASVVVVSIAISFINNNIIVRIIILISIIMFGLLKRKKLILTFKIFIHR